MSEPINNQEIAKKTIGRPKIGESNKAKYRQKAFYFPLRLEKVFKEFDGLAKKEFRFVKFPERCKSLLIRKFILEYVYNKTDSREVKKMIEDYQEYEDERVHK